jgi:hypothetical protein
MVLATHSIRQFPLHFPSLSSPCAITFQLKSTSCMFLTVVCGSTDFIIGALKEVQWLFHSLRVHWHSMSERLCTRIILTVHRARIRSIITYASAT